MPPKKGAKAKSPKLSKAEKERLKKEEIERKAKEEEEARLQLEQEQREKEEKERIEREEKERLAQQEREQHHAEVDELNGMLEDKYSVLRNAENENRENVKWKRYMLCDGSPDPKITKEINTYMNLWKEDTAPKPVHKTLQECHDALKLIDELQYFLGDEPGLAEEDVEKHNESITTLQLLIREKLDEATMHILKNPGDQIDPDTQNIQFEIKSRLISLNIWGNISRNPRIKSLTFEKESVEIEIPKPLAVGNFALRCLFTGYDHLSEKCRLFFPRPKKTVVDIPVVMEPVVETIDETSENKKEGENDDAISVAIPERVRSTLASKPPSSTRSARKSREKDSSTPTTASKGRRKSARSQLNTPVETDTNDSKTNTDIDGVNTPGDDTTSEKPVENRPLNDDIEFEEDDDEDVVDLRAFSTTSKVIFMDLYELPPQAKAVSGWIIQQIVSPNLIQVPYAAQLKRTKSEDFTASEDEQNNDSSLEKTDSSIANTTPDPPIALSMRLPVDVCYFEQPQVARWDAEKKQWRLDGFTDVKFNDKSNMLNFTIDRFSPIGIFQDLYLNMPFQSWELRPHGVNSCLFTIVAAAIDLEIEIKDSVCCVSHAEDSVQRLHHLIGKWMRPKDLIKKLKASAVNIFPAVDADKYVSVNVKDFALEKSLYEQMALTASSFAFSWSRWNSDCGKEKIVIQATEQLYDEPSMEDSWFVFLVSKENSCKLKLNEFDETFSDDVAENTKLHADLYHMVMDDASGTSKQKIKDTSSEFFDSVLQFLMATKVLTYS